jgi:uncharacterized lipoprotein YajG
MRSWLGLAVVASVGLVSGCAFTDATIKVAYREPSPGALATVPPRRVEIGPIQDKRPETDKVGYKRNGFNQKTAKIQTAKPVPEIVREALAAELAKNGHVVGGPDSDFVLSADVTEFWLDISVGMFTMDFVGATGVELRVSPRAAAGAPVTRQYRGYHKETAMGGLEGTWEHVMNTALQHMMREMATDVRLAQALRVQSP